MSITNKKEKRLKDDEQINYGARTRQYKKLIGKPLSKVTINDVKKAFEDADNIALFNPNDFLNWILSGAIPKNVYNAIKKEVIKCQLP